MKSTPQIQAAEVWNKPSETPGSHKYIAPGGEKHANEPVMTTDVILRQWDWREMGSRRVGLHISEKQNRTKN